MATEILMPELGESVHEGTVSRWIKNVGDFVKEDEPVVEIMTDKVNTELGAPASGTLVKILIPEGGDVAVFATMGIIEEDAELAKQMLADAGWTDSDGNGFVDKDGQELTIRTVYMGSWPLMQGIAPLVY
ncbi:MAG TPA: hypothetical protein DCY02_07540 [Armatimonadetes bacterium]|nr:hypothetical protein [Armatimonadota bacterium]